MSALLHADEMYYMLRMKMRTPPQLKSTSKDVIYAYEMLVKTSRSFAMVIQELGDELRDAVCIFYLVLRALDTVEDDTTYPVEKRVALLNVFYTKLDQPGWTFNECGVAHEKELLMNFDKIIAVYQTLPPGCRSVIQDICKRMGMGMADFSVKKVESKADYDLYCHYVAGLVGVGLSKLFAHSKLEDEKFFDMDNISNRMGLFLQRTNIIRDYLDDINHARVFWPKEVWAKYATDIADFKDPKNIKQAVYCLNDLITDALELIPDCLTYLSALRNQKVFNFCAIPQVMAVATLSLCYGNPAVFTSVVKLRRGLSAKMVHQSTNMSTVYYYFWVFLNVIESKLQPDDPSRDRAIKAIAAARAAIPKEVQQGWNFSSKDVITLGLFAVFSAYLIYNHATPPPLSRV